MTALSQSGSFLDGGANHPYVSICQPHILDLITILECSSPLSHFWNHPESLWKKYTSLRCTLVLPAIRPNYMHLQVALQKHFKAKRDHVLARLRELHLDVDIPPSSTFYIWLNLEKLPEPLNNGLVRFPSLTQGRTYRTVFLYVFPRHSSRNSSRRRRS